MSLRQHVNTLGKLMEIFNVEIDVQDFQKIWKDKLSVVSLKFCYSCGIK